MVRVFGFRRVVYTMLVLVHSSLRLSHNAKKRAVA